MGDGNAGIFHRNVPIIGICKVVFVIAGTKIVVYAPSLSIKCLRILCAQSESKIRSFGIEHNASGVHRFLFSENGLLLNEVVERRYDFGASWGSVNFSTSLNAEVKRKILNAVSVKRDIGLVDVVG